MSCRCVLSLALSLFGLVLFADPATGWLQTGAGPYDYNDTANWVNGEINGIFGDDLALTANQTITFDADTVVTGLSIAQTGAFSITFKAGETAGAATLMLADDFTNSGAGAVTFDSTLTLDLGSATRTFDTAKALAFKGVIQNGGVTVDGSGEVTFSGANTYESGTTLAGTGKVNIENTSAFGTGRLTLSQGCSLNSRVSSFTSTLPITLAGDFTWTTDKKLNPNFGVGELTILRPLTATINSGYTLTLGGPIAEDSPCDFTDVVKAGNGSLSTKAPITVDGEATLTVTSGNWYFSGAVNGSGRLVKTGGAYLQIDAESAFNGFSGTLEISAGTVRFTKKYVLNDHIKFLITGSGILRSNTSKDCGYAYSILGLLPYVDKASTGSLGMSSNEGSGEAVLDLTDYPDLTVAPNGGDFTFTGRIVPPSTGVLKLGGGGKTLTLAGVLPSGCDIDASTGSLTLSVDQPNFDGVIDTGKNKMTLSTGVSMPKGSVVCEGGSVVIGNNEQCTVSRLKSLTLRSGATVTVNAPSGGDRENRIDELHCGFCDPIIAGIPRVSVNNTTEFDNVLYLGKIERERGIEMLHVVTTATGAGVSQVCVDANGVGLVGSGTAGTVQAPVIPFVINNNEPATLGESGEIRQLTADEYVAYDSTDGSFEGTVEAGANIVVSGANTFTVTQSATVNSIWLQGNTQFAAADGVSLKVDSGLVFVASDGSAKFGAAVDFGGVHGIMCGKSDTEWDLAGPIAGSAGLTICDGGYSLGGSGALLNSVNTYAGDTYLACYTKPKNAEFFPNGKNRPGDLYLGGKLMFNSGNVKLNAFYGKGTVDCSGSGGSSMQLGCAEGTVGNYVGSFANNATGHNFTMTVQKGAHQRMETAIGIKYTVEIYGELQVDGTINAGRSGSNIAIHDGGVLSGEGTVTAANLLVMDSGAVLAPGSAEIPNQPMKLGKNLQMAQGASFRFYVDDSRASQAIVSAGYGLTGAATSVPVVVDCQATKAGEWLLLEADSFGGKTFELDRTIGRSGKRIQVRKVMSEDGQTVVREQLWLTVRNGLAVIFR